MKVNSKVRYRDLWQPILFLVLAMSQFGPTYMDGIDRLIDIAIRFILASCLTAFALKELLNFLLRMMREGK
jgi:hypothetical protein